eukprot:scaffold26288_cov111-Isochrysis_galbana.AAC.17
MSRATRDSHCHQATPKGRLRPRRAESAAFCINVSAGGRRLGTRSVRPIHICDRTLRTAAPPTTTDEAEELLPPKPCNGLCSEGPLPFSIFARRADTLLGSSADLATEAVLTDCAAGCLAGCEGRADFDGPASAPAEVRTGETAASVDAARAAAARSNRSC